MKMADNSTEKMRICDIPAGAHFLIRDLIDGERRATFYTRSDGQGNGRFVPTLLHGFYQWDRDGALRKMHRNKTPTPQMTDGLALAFMEPAWTEDEMRWTAISEILTPNDDAQATKEA
jgi:hypothetical protein